MTHVLEWLESTQFSALVRSELWGWPLALTLHALGTALVIGLVLIIGLRLLGLFQLIPYTSLNRLFPVIWVALALQLLSGFTLWMTKPTQYVADVAFLLKVSLVIVGTILTLALYGIVTREAVSWDAKRAVSSRAVTFVAATVLVWCGALVAGRLTAYLGSI
jgi:hypothetical protein